MLFTPLENQRILNLRYKVLEAFHKIVNYSEVNEPGVISYIATIPIEDVLGTEIYMIEEYASEEANTAHLTAPPVQELISLFGTGDVLASAPEVYNNNITAQKAVTGALTVSSDPAIILAHNEYTPGTLSPALKCWKDVAEHVKKNEDGTKAYTVLATEGRAEVRTVEIYESWEYMQNVHLKNSTIKAHQQCFDGTTVKGTVRLRCVHGFFGNGRAGSKI